MIFKMPKGCPIMQINVFEHKGVMWASCLQYTNSSESGRPLDGMAPHVEEYRTWKAPNSEEPSADLEARLKKLEWFMDVYQKHGPIRMEYK